MDANEALRAALLRRGIPPSGRAPMDANALCAALSAVEASDEPTSKAQARKLAASLAGVASTVRGQLDDLDDALCRAEDAAGDLGEADPEELEAAYLEAVEAAGELRVELGEFGAAG